MPKQPLILIVDDEPDFLEIFGTKLSAEGFRIETAESGEAGIKKAKELQPDLVLMDVKMPKVDGAEALMRLKDDQATKNLKVVFLTGMGEPWVESQALSKRFSKEFGALEYIKKTDDLEHLTERVRALTQ